MNSSSSSQSLFNGQVKQTKSSGSRLIINRRFVVCSLKEHRSDYNFYQGIDTEKTKWVNIYIKIKDSSFSLSKGVAEGIRNQICPKIIESGEVEISKSKFSYEVHERTGPSLDTIFKELRRELKPKELLHLLLQVVSYLVIQLKLIEKIDSLRLVNGQLDSKSIVFDNNPLKNELSLLNCFSLKRKKYEGKVKQTKYSSRGVYLGRSKDKINKEIEVMDDLESICYILMDAYTQGGFLAQRIGADQLEDKLSLKAELFAPNLPQAFLDFYYYVTSLNCGDDINFYYWKSYISKHLAKETLTNPYGFLLAKNDQKTESEEISDAQDVYETLEDAEKHKSQLMAKMQRTIVKDMIKER